MPITFTPTPPAGAAGPGLPFTISSTVGSVPSGSYFRIQTFTDSAHTQNSYVQDFPTTTTTLGAHLLDGQTVVNWTPGQAAQRDDSTAYLQMFLFSGTGTELDSGTVSVPWDTQSGMPYWISQQINSGAAGGFNSTDRITLASVNGKTNTLISNWNNYTSVTLPSLNSFLSSILTGVTATITSAAGAASQTLGQIFSAKTWDLLERADAGSVCDGETLDVNISGDIVWGVEVNTTTVPDFYGFIGPDDAVCSTTLFDVQYVRGGSTVVRDAVRTRTYMRYPIPAVPFPVVEFNFPQVPLDYHVLVTPATGVCVDVKVLSFP